MVREVASHGWPLAAPDAYPFPRRIDQDGVLHPMEARDLDVLAATALAKLFGAHGEEIARGRSVEATASYRGGIEVRARMPYGSAGAGLSAHAAASNAEVEDFAPGATLDLRDLLTGERRRVQEKMGSRGVSKRVALLGAVVEHQGAFLMTGTYPHTMPPGEHGEPVANGGAIRLPPLRRELSFAAESPSRPEE